MYNCGRLKVTSDIFVAGLCLKLISDWTSIPLNLTSVLFWIQALFSDPQVQDKSNASFTSKYSLHKYSVIKKKSILSVLPLAFQRRWKSYVAEMSMFTKYFIYLTWPPNSHVAWCNLSRVKCMSKLAVWFPYQKPTLPNPNQRKWYRGNRKKANPLVPVQLICIVILQCWYELNTFIMWHPVNFGTMKHHTLVLLCMKANLFFSFFIF